MSVGGILCEAAALCGSAVAVPCECVVWTRPTMLDAGASQCTGADQLPRVPFTDLRAGAVHRAVVEAGCDCRVEHLSREDGEGLQHLLGHARPVPHVLKLQQRVGTDSSHWLHRRSLSRWQLSR